MVVTRVRDALSRLDALGREYAGYRRLNLGDRYTTDLLVAGASASATLAQFYAHAPSNNVDAAAVIESLRKSA